MKQEKLFAKLLSDGLTAAELRDLKKLLADSPDAARELEQLQALENSLRDHGAPNTRQTENFLSAMENNVAGTLKQRGPAEVVAALGQRSMMSSAVYIISAFILLLGSAGAIYTINASSDEPTDAATDLALESQAENVDSGNELDQAQSAEYSDFHSSGNTPGSNMDRQADLTNSQDLPASAMQSNHSLNNSDLENGATQSRFAQGLSQSNINHENINNSESGLDADALHSQDYDLNTNQAINRTDEAEFGDGAGDSMLGMGSSNDPPDGLKQQQFLLEEDLAASLSKDDKLYAAIHARKLGIYWRERGTTHSAKSRAYFEQSIGLTNNSASELIRAETLGEYALLEARLGNTEKARELLTNCVNSLTRLSGEKLHRWQVELDKLR